MLGGISKYRDVVVVGACLLLPALILYAQSRSTAEAGPVVRALVQLTGPVQGAVATLVSGVADAWTTHWQNAESLEDARALRMEVSALRRQVERLGEVERENGRLRELLHAAPTPGPARFTAARVVAVGASPVWRSIRVDAGRDQGVARGMAVVGAQGAVGSVLRTSHAYSDVLLITDRQSAVDVVLPRTGARGLMRGTGVEDGAALMVEGLDRQNSVAPGDEVVCSGLGAHFPGGTKVGVVERVEVPEGSLAATAWVQASVRFDQLSAVLLVLAPDQPGTRLPSALPLPLAHKGRPSPPTPPVLGPNPAPVLGPAAPHKGDVASGSSSGSGQALSSAASPENQDTPGLAPPSLSSSSSPPDLPLVLAPSSSAAPPAVTQGTHDGAVP